MEIKINCFVSYSHNDTEFKNFFLDNLREFFKENRIDFWNDSQLKPGQNWYYSIHEKLEESNIVFCLISKNFLKSDPCNDELKRAMNAYRNGTNTVIPIILNKEEVNTDELICSSLHYCPVEDGHVKPISDWPSIKDGFRNACLQLKPVIEDLLKLLKNKDRKWRFREIQNLIGENKIMDGLKELLVFTREFCSENMLLETKICIKRSLFSNLEEQLRKNPGDIIEKIEDLLKVMDEVYKACGCETENIN